MIFISKVDWLKSETGNLGKSALASAWEGGDFCGGSAMSVSQDAAPNYVYY